METDNGDRKENKGIEEVYKHLERDQEYVLIITSVKQSGETYKSFLGANYLNRLEKLEIEIENSEIYSLVNRMILTGMTSSVIESEGEIFIIDIIRRERTIIVLGAGHVGRSVALIAVMTGFNVILIDDREGFLSRDKIIDERVKCLCIDFQSAFSKCLIDSNSAVVIVTRGHQYDSICLREALKCKAQYIGMIGSKRRVLSIKKQLEQTSLSNEEQCKLDKVYAPIGLEIGARLPEEIAISILAQIIQVMNLES